MSNYSGQAITGGRRHDRHGLAVLTALALVVAACGSSSESTSSTDSEPAASDTEPVSTTPSTEKPSSTDASTDTTPTSEAIADTTPAPTEPPTTDPPVQDAAACLAEVETKSPGSLTVHTWTDFGADGLSTTSAFDGAVLYAVAEQPGFADADVIFELEEADIETGFIVEGETTFDIGISAISITDPRAETIDFSDSYYDVEQLLVASADSPVVGAASVSDLAGTSLGVFDETASVVVGASGEYVTAAIAPATAPTVYPSIWVDTSAAQSALDGGTVDALVLDAPSALYALQPDGLGMSNASVVAVLPRQDEPVEQLGIVIQKGSPLVGCVNQALTTLRDDGTLADLEDQWLHGGDNIPTLSK